MTGVEIKDVTKDICEDCGAGVAGGKPGCRRIFEEVIAGEFVDYRYGKIHRLTVDAYSLQHPGQYMRSAKSFAAHLTGICAALEHADAFEINRAVQRWLSRNPTINKPSRLPQLRAELTILYVHGAPDAAEHHRRVRDWAQSVWEAWDEHHDLARQLIGEAKAETNER